MVRNKEYYLEKKELKKVKSKRCLLCGKDKEILMPQILKVNEQTLKKIGEIVNKDSNFKLINSSYNDPIQGGEIDDISLKLIKGYGYQISMDICLECINKIGHLHKFKKKYLHTPFAIKYI